MLQLWLHCRPGPMTPARLPFAGGYADQPARTMAVLSWMDHIASVLTPQK